MEVIDDVTRAYAKGLHRRGDGKTLFAPVVSKEALKFKGGGVAEKKQKKDEVKYLSWETEEEALFKGVAMVTERLLFHEHMLGFSADGHCCSLIQLQMRC